MKLYFIIIIDVTATVGYAEASKTNRYPISVDTRKEGVRAIGNGCDVSNHVRREGRVGAIVDE